jgi:hypothetical protein
MIYHSSSQDVDLQRKGIALMLSLRQILKVKGRHSIPNVYHYHNSSFNPTLITSDIQYLENQQSPSAELEQEQPFTYPLRLTRQQ